MKEQVRALKRAVTESAEGEEERPKKKGKVVTEDPYKHAASAGKKYTALYDVWGTKAAIFEGFRTAALKAGQLLEDDESTDGSSDEGKSNDEENSSIHSSTDDDKDDDDDRPCKKGAKGGDEGAGQGNEEVDHLNFADPEQQETYTRESAERFWQDAKPSDVKNWQKAKYRARVSQSL
jgi:hypothetical protein